MKAKSCGQAGPDRVAQLLRVDRLEGVGKLIADAAPGLVGVLSVANPMKRGESALGENRSVVHLGRVPPNMQCWKSTSSTVGLLMMAKMNGSFQNRLFFGFPWPK